MSDTDRLDAFFKTALQLAEEGKRGRKILQANSGGVIKTEHYVRDVAPGFDGHVRELVREVVFGVWNVKKRAATLAEIYNGVEDIPGVAQKVNEEMQTGTWPKAVWDFPSKRTTDRRANELASDDRTMWLGLPFQPVISLKPGHYQPNPMNFDESVRDAIAEAGR